MSLTSRKLIQASAGVGGATDPGDDDFANVVLLLDGDGTSGDDNNTFTDSSNNSFPVTENGSVVQGSFSPYGDNWSVDLTLGTTATASYLQTSALSNIASSSGSFTIEFWFMPESVTTNYASNSFATIMDAEAGSGTATNAWWAIHQQGASLVFAHNNGNRLTASNVLTIHEWHHCALVRSGSTLKWYVNGTEASSTTYTNQIDGGRVIDIGKQGTNRWNKCFISNIRIVNGTALYTSSYDIPTSPLTDVSGTVLLCCKSNRFIDESSQNETIDPTGTVKITPFSPFKNNDARDITTDVGSGYFDGTTGNYIDIPNNSALEPSGDFTIEFWAYVTDSSGTQEWYSKGYGIQIYISGSRWGVALSSNNTSSYYVNSLTNLVDNNAWTHIALTRSGNDYKFFINGSIIVNTTNASSPSTGTGVVRFGDWSGGTGYTAKGYISDVRYLNGTAAYTSAFTPPTSPLSAITNTNLLCNFQDAGIYDRTGIHNLNDVGNTQLDTAVVKYGSGSMQFDGSGDYIKVAQATEPQWHLFKSKFTIECWVYASSLGSYNGVLSAWPSNGGSVNNAWILETVGSDMEFYWSEGSTLRGPLQVGSCSAGQWIHYAVTYDGTTVRGFKNGTLQDSLAPSGTVNIPNSTIHIGTVFAPGGDWNGYIDDLRVTLGVARYTSNFTAPDAALPKF